MITHPHRLLLALGALAASCGGSSAAPDAGNDAPTCTGDNPALRCRAPPNDCIPSGCACSAGGWACTADCSGGRSCGDGGSDGGTDSATDAGSDGDAGARDRCEATGGIVQSRQCCQATSDFPSTCSVGACGCAPADSHAVFVCACPADSCFVPERGCAVPACTPGADQTCNDDPSLSSLHGRCQFDHTCVCEDGFSLNVATGRCR